MIPGRISRHTSIRITRLGGFRHILWHETTPTRTCSYHFGSCPPWYSSSLASALFCLNPSAWNSTLPPVFGFVATALLRPSGSLEGDADCESRLFSAAAPFYKGTRSVGESKTVRRCAKDGHPPGGRAVKKGFVSIEGPRI